MDDRVKQVEAFLRRFTEIVELPLTAPILTTSITVMARYRPRSYDAVHVASALSVGIADFASVDADFRRVSNLRLRLLRDAPP